MHGQHTFGVRFLAGLRHGEARGDLQIATPPSEPSARKHMTSRPSEERGLVALQRQGVARPDLFHGGAPPASEGLCPGAGPERWTPEVLTSRVVVLSMVMSMPSKWPDAIALGLPSSLHTHKHQLFICAATGERDWLCGGNCSSPAVLDDLEHDQPVDLDAVELGRRGGDLRPYKTQKQPTKVRETARVREWTRGNTPHTAPPKPSSRAERVT